MRSSSFIAAMLGAAIVLSPMTNARAVELKALAGGGIAGPLNEKEAGMSQMSDKFNAMGQQVYVDADKVTAPHTTALDTEAAHTAKNASLVKESNKAL